MYLSDDDIMQKSSLGGRGQVWRRYAIISSVQTGKQDYRSRQLGKWGENGCSVHIAGRKCRKGFYPVMDDQTFVGKPVNIKPVGLRIFLEREN